MERPDYAQLYAAATSLLTKAGLSAAFNTTRAGLWGDIARAAEQLAGTTSTANSTIDGYMTRAAVALEGKFGGSGTEESGNRAGLLKRIVDAFELNAGVGTGSYGNRLQSGATNVVFDSAALAALKASTSALAVYDVSNRSTLGQGLTDTSTAVAANDPVGFVRNIKPSATAYNLIAPSGSARPLSTNGLTFDGSDDKLAFSFGGGAGPASMTVISIMKVGPVVSVLYAYDGYIYGPYAVEFVAADAAGTAGGTLLVDGVAKALRDDFYKAACNGAAHTIQHLAGNFSAWPTFTLSGYPGLPFNGVLIPVALLDPGAGDYAAALTNALTWASELKTKLGL